MKHFLTFCCYANVPGSSCISAYAALDQSHVPGAFILVVKSGTWIWVVGVQSVLLGCVIAPRSPSANRVWWCLYNFVVLSYLRFYALKITMVIFTVHNGIAILAFCKVTLFMFIVPFLYTLLHFAFFFHLKMYPENYSLAVHGRLPYSWFRLRSTPLP